MLGPDAYLIEPLTGALTLGQGLVQEFLSKPDIRPLPEPGVFERFFFEGSILLWGALIAAGLVGLIGFASRGKAKLGLAVGGGFVLAAVGAWLTAHLVTTDREIVMDNVSELIRVTAAADVDALESFLDEDLRLSISGFATNMPRDAVLGLVRAQLGGSYRVSSHKVLERQAVMDGPYSARSQVSVRVDGEGFGRIGSWWRIDWLDRGEGWKVVAIEALYIPGVVGEPD
ncbi:MAG: hypothetical protein AAGI53_13685 [Planctomycetota bacterium]